MWWGGGRACWLFLWLWWGFDLLLAVGSASYFVSVGFCLSRFWGWVKD